MNTFNLYGLDAFDLVKLLHSNHLTLDQYTQVRKELASMALTWLESLEAGSKETFYKTTFTSCEDIHDLITSHCYAYAYMTNNGFTHNELLLLGTS